ncbi:hypothetical protein HID58_017561 [Brassica napus]|uniref:pectinesterase n=1 Tax=Brassica napus TaxID=3708 RepID=A0ABQ8D7F6_BRANA|nr:hypothetical protein HID58_017561 [Brassica napus]
MSNGIYGILNFGKNSTAFGGYPEDKNAAPGPEHGVQGAQVVALRLEGDQAAFYGCGFYSVHETLLDSAGRHFFKGCFIQDAIDFIYGAERSIDHVKETTSGISGIITTQGKDSKSQPT